MVNGLTCVTSLIRAMTFSIITEHKHSVSKAVFPKRCECLCSVTIGTVPVHNSDVPLFHFPSSQQNTQIGWYVECGDFISVCIVRSCVSSVYG